MIENVVELGAEPQLEFLAKPECLVDAEIRSPGSRPSQQITLGDVWVVKHVGASGRQPESIRVEEAVAGSHLRIARDNGTECVAAAEASDRINRGAVDIAERGRAAIVAEPIRREPIAALGEHVPRNLPSACDQVNR